jgi:hypothetical protein
VWTGFIRRVYSSGWLWCRTIVEWCRRRKTDSCTRTLSGNPTSITIW